MIKNNFDSLPQYEKDNKVHHLGINSNQIGEGCILTSNLERIEIMKDYLQDPQKEAFHREYITYTGQYDDVKMSVMTIGNGCMPSEIAVEELRHIGCTKMIKIGSCYAYDENIKPGTIFVPTGACRCEGATLEYLGIEYPAIPDHELLFEIIRNAKKMGIEIETGIIKTHDALFLESPFAHDDMEERIAPWKKIGVKCVDNEAATILTVSSILQSKAAVIYVVTDNLSTNESLDFENEYENKIRQTIELSLKSLSSLCKKG